MFTEKVKYAIEKYNMLENCGCVTVGLSGGADSTALLYALMELQNLYRIKIQAVHINHCLRGNESDDDEKFCRELCHKLNVPFYSKKIDVVSYMNEHGLSCEESARILRYRAFDEYCNGGLIATAHTLSDNTETVIHNLARGTGLKGLTGIPPVRDNIIRPLIMVTRDEVEKYLDLKSQTFVTDSTNLTDDYTRNKIRHHIVPEFEKINPSFLKTMSSNISALQLENSFISEMSMQAYQKCCTGENQLNGLKNYHKAIRHRCIAEFLNRHKLRYSCERISAIDNLVFKDAKINIAENVYIISKSGILFIEHITPDTDNDNSFRLPLEAGINKISEKKYCHAEILSGRPDENVDCLLDYDKVNGRIFIRSRKYGDKIHLAGKNFTSSVKKTLINMKIPSDIRKNLCFLEDDSGLLFAEKMGIADRVLPDENTVRFLAVRITENGNI